MSLFKSLKYFAKLRTKEQREVILYEYSLELNSERSQAIHGQLS